MIEIEQRYKVVSPQRTIEDLASKSVLIAGTKHIVDRWFMPSSIRNRADHDKWFDEARGIAYRIRQTDSPDGTSKIVLESKQLTTDGNHNTFAEDVVLEDDLKQMESILAEKDYYNWLTIDKTRTFFKGMPSNLLATMDTVQGVKDALGLDTVLEIEFDGEATRDEALRTIDDFAASIGFSPDDLFEKSLTVESMRVLARFQ